MSTTPLPPHLTSSQQRVEGLPDRVIVRQLYLGCLSQASYLVGDAVTGRAIAVDPRRDVDELLRAAEDAALTVELIVETHFHADFLSGHLELAEATGAPIGIGAAGTTEFDAVSLTDGYVIDLGGVQVEVLETPGHTPESISLVVRPGPGEAPVAVLTGDTLFIGDVGRPDLLVAADVPAADLARRLHASLQRLLELPDETLVLPAHGAGSSCGRSLSSETVSTVGIQRRDNHALQPMSVESFVAMVTTGQPAAPAYFGHDASLNRQARDLLPAPSPAPALDLTTLDRAVADGAVVVDIRSAEAFARGHLAGSISVALDGRFAEQVGSVVPVGTPVVLAGPAEAFDEAKVRLARIGFDGVVGTVADPAAVVATHPDRGERSSRLTAADLDARRTELGDALQLVDVRNPGETELAPVPGAVSLPLAQLRDRMGELDPEHPIVLVCAGGARSAVAASVLRSAGYHDVSDVLGGAAALGVAAGCSTSTPSP